MTDTEQRLRDIVTNEVKQYLRTGGKFNRLAKSCKLSPATISRLAYGETRYPRMHTIVVVLLHFGYEIEATKSATGVLQYSGTVSGRSPRSKELRAN